MDFTFSPERITPVPLGAERRASTTVLSAMDHPDGAP